MWSSDCGGLFIGEYDGSGCVDGSGHGDEISNDRDNPGALTARLAVEAAPPVPGVFQRLFCTPTDNATTAISKMVRMHQFDTRSGVLTLQLLVCRGDYAAAVQSTCGWGECYRRAAEAGKLQRVPAGVNRDSQRTLKERV
jgi:hypothetical protein